MAKPKNLLKCTSTVIKVYDGTAIGKVVSVISHFDERTFTAQAEEGCVEVGTQVVFRTIHCPGGEPQLGDRVLLLGIGSTSRGEHFSFEVDKL
ncbi:MAG: hypothetical protein WAW92_01945 [Minisyncoccia bacterium]